ncbi:MAG: P-type conjugative transfer protein TrbG [Robiginitomaculum sp.]|nr:MAG: P-type conjugative transfer protein TrbG [Robiginitomaculum sp.]
MTYPNFVKPIMIAALAISLSGCASFQGAWTNIKSDLGGSGKVTTPAQMSKAVYVFDEPMDVQTLEEDVFMPSLIMPGQMKARPVKARPVQVTLFETADYKPDRAVNFANKSAAVQPSSDNYLNAIQIYPYTPGSLYQVYTAPGQVTDIALERGEGLTSVSAGDTVRWIVGDTVSGTGASEQVHVLIKPTAPNLRTNLVITTTKRTYYLELHSYKDTYMAAVSWRYPRQSFISKHRQKQANPEKVRLTQTGITPRLENLHFDYIIKGDTPKWRPVRVFDDGRKVFIEFPKNFARTEAPPLFITGKKGKGQLVNYRIKGNYYVVDRLFEAAELRIGEKKQTIVRIEREDKNS